MMVIAEGMFLVISALSIIIFLIAMFDTGDFKVAVGVGLATFATMALIVIALALFIKGGMMITEVLG